MFCFNFYSILYLQNSKLKLFFIFTQCPQGRVPTCWNSRRGTKSVMDRGFQEDLAMAVSKEWVSDFFTFETVSQLFVQIGNYIFFCEQVWLIQEPSQ